VWARMTLAGNRSSRGHAAEQGELNMARPKAVTLDAGGTLVHMERPVGEIYAEFAARFGCHTGPGELELRFRDLFFRLSGEVGGGPETKQVTPDVERAWWKELVRILFAECGGVPDFDRFFDELHSHFASPDLWRIYPEAIQSMQLLREAGIRMAIVSNWDTRLPQLLERMGITVYTEVVVVSSLEGISKPDTGIFRIALERLGTRPEETVHVGDSLRDDVWGAMGAGMDSVWLRRGGLEGKRPGDTELEKKLAAKVRAAPDLTAAAGIILGS